MEIPPQVFARAQKLRRGALEELFAAVYPAVVRIARGLAGREDVAEGVVRFVMVRAVGMTPKWRDETAAERWFLHHTVLTARRAVDAGHAPAAKSDLLLGADAADPQYAAFVRAMRQLPVQQREAVLLHYGERFNARYLGVAMDCSTDAAQAHLQAGTGALQAVSRTEFAELMGRLVDAYAQQGPRSGEIAPAVGRHVRRGLRPRRVRRVVVLGATLIVLAAVAFAAWTFRGRLGI
jgi:DNA-directed RNA polymerase specialized sigma24 family protein